MNFTQFIGSLELGLIYSLIAIAVFLTFRIINFSDMTVDGSFTLGAAVGTALILKGFSPILATFLACCAGAIAGIFTAILSVKLKILDLLASILIMTALYSINLRIMGGPNLSLISVPTIFGESGPTVLSTITIICFLIIFITLSIIWFLSTEFGLAMKATGINPIFSRAYGSKVSRMIIIAVAMSNSLVALAGVLFSQSKEFADISMGTGTIIIGLASVFIGETIFKTRKMSIAVLSCLIGSILYRFAITLALNTGFLGLQASDLNLITSAIVIATLFSSRFKKK